MGIHVKANQDPVDRRARNWKTVVFGLTLTVIGADIAQAAEPLAYVRSSSQHGKARVHHALNLLDDDPESIWCEGRAGLGEGEEIRFFFKRPQRIDRIVIAPSSKTGRHIEVVRVSDGTNTVQIPIGDAIVEQPLRQPMRGKTYTVSIEQVGGKNAGASLAEDVACLGDVLLYQGKQLFGGKMPANKLRYDKMRDQVLGRWSGEPLGAPEKFLTFALDGTWEWNFQPLLDGKPERASGEYRFRGNRLLMRVGEAGRWTDMRFKYERRKVDSEEIGAPQGDYDLIVLNDALNDAIGGEYNNAEF